MVLTDRDRQILGDVGQFRILTRHQLERLGHFGSKTRANAILLRLTRFGYLSRRHLPTIAGTQRGLYYLGPKGVALGSDPHAAHTSRRKARALSDLFAAHQLAVTDVLVSFRQAPACSIQRWMTDDELRSTQLGVVPDGHIEYRFNDKQFGAFVELDRGTETLGRFQGKVRAYQRLAGSGTYQRVFGRPYFRVLVIATSARRIEHLRRATASLTD
ncbi:MAG: replication-relaxation family protein, partial [Vicinamibacterales bacterium]